jgi:hypothetical protein
LSAAKVRCRRGAFQIGNQHGDLLALALQGGLGGEDFLGTQGYTAAVMGEAYQAALESAP